MRFANLDLSKPAAEQLQEEPEQLPDPSKPCSKCRWVTELEQCSNPRTQHWMRGFGFYDVSVSIARKELSCGPEGRLWKEPMMSVWWWAFLLAGTFLGAFALRIYGG